MRLIVCLSDIDNVSVTITLIAVHIWKKANLTIQYYSRILYLMREFKVLRNGHE